MERVRGNEQETAADSGYKAAFQSRAVAVSDMSMAFRRAGHERVPLLRRADVRRVFILRQACRDGLSRTRAPAQGCLNPLRRRRRESFRCRTPFPGGGAGKFRVIGGQRVPVFSDNREKRGRPRLRTSPGAAIFSARGGTFGKPRPRSSLSGRIGLPRFPARFRESEAPPRNGDAPNGESLPGAGGSRPKLSHAFSAEDPVVPETGVCGPFSDRFALRRSREITGDLTPVGG